MITSLVLFENVKKECSRVDDTDMSVEKRLNDIPPPNVVVEQRNLPVFQLCNVERGRGNFTA